MKENLFSQFTLPDPITAEYYDSIDLFSLESIWQLAYRDLSQNVVNVETESKISELCFNSQTVFPDKLKKLAQTVLEDGKKAHLNNHTGFTGKGIKTAIIDRPLPVNHIEFWDRIQYIEVVPGHEANTYIDFHGTTCASYLCGKTCGAAGGVDLFYFAIPNHMQHIETYYEWQLQALEKIVEYNRRHDDPIRIVSLSAPFHTSQIERRNALEKELLSTGCTLIDAMMHMRNFSGIDYDQYTGKYSLNRWQVENYERNKNRDNFVEYFDQLCFVPSARRTAASFDSVDEYIHFSKAVSESWTIPHVTGAFAICLEKNSRLTYEDFVKIAKTCPRKDGFTVLDIDHIIGSI